MEKTNKHYGLNNHNLQNGQKSDDVESQQAENNLFQDSSEQYEDEIDIDDKSDLDENYGYNVSKYHDQYEEEDFYEEEEEDDDEDEGEHEGRG